MNQIGCQGRTQRLVSNVTSLSPEAVDFFGLNKDKSDVICAAEHHMKRLRRRVAFRCCRIRDGFWC